MMATEYPEVVYELDEWWARNGTEHQVKHICQVCFRYRPNEGHTNWIFNKKTGMLHLPGYYTSETTHCGKPCTEDSWLHQL